MANNRTYEVMYIADPKTADDTIADLNTAIQELIESNGGTVTKTEDMGRKPLAYPIQKNNDGYYTLFEIEGSGQEIAELERRMRVNDIIMRYLTVRVDEERKAADRLTAKRERGKAKRASADFGENQSEDQNNQEEEE